MDVLRQHDARTMVLLSAYDCAVFVSIDSLEVAEECSKRFTSLCDSHGCSSGFVCGVVVGQLCDGNEHKLRSSSTTSVLGRINWISTIGHEF